MINSPVLVYYYYRAVFVNRNNNLLPVFLPLLWYIGALPHSMAT